MYVTICNNPREKRFRREETILACVIPGPTEPSLEQVNNVITPFIEDVLRLGHGAYPTRFMHDFILMYKADTPLGVSFRVYQQPAPVIGHGQVLVNSSDLPASRKMSGLRGVTTKWWMCGKCDQTVPSLTNPDCFDPSSKSND